MKKKELLTLEKLIRPEGRKKNWPQITRQFTPNSITSRAPDVREQSSSTTSTSNRLVHYRGGSIAAAWLNGPPRIISPIPARISPLFINNFFAISLRFATLVTQIESRIPRPPAFFVSGFVVNNLVGKKEAERGDRVNYSRDKEIFLCWVEGRHACALFSEIVKI